METSVLAYVGRYQKENFRREKSSVCPNYWGSFSRKKNWMDIFSFSVFSRNKKSDGYFQLFGIFKKKNQMDFFSFSVFSRGHFHADLLSD
jgi:hypothetical protein